MDTRTYFAQVTDGVVTDVRVVSQEFIDANPERYSGTWIEVFVDVEGKTYPSVGYTFDGTNFVAPQPFASWTLDANNNWQPPTPMPSGGNYVWFNPNRQWIEIIEP